MRLHCATWIFKLTDRVAFEMLLIEDIFMAL